MQKIAFVTALLVALLVIGSASGHSTKAQGGGVDWACNRVCTINAYQFTGSYVANIYNGSGTMGSFSDPYSYTVDIYAHRNGVTIHHTCPASGCFTGFTFSN